MDDTQRLHSGPSCSCGRGAMIRRVAGAFSSNPGRPYYKCPVGVKHHRSFVWCDELNWVPGLASFSTSFNQPFPRAESSGGSQPSGVQSSRSVPSAAVFRRRTPATFYGGTETNTGDQTNDASYELQVFLPNLVTSSFASLVIVMVMVVSLLVIGFILGFLFGSS